MADYILVVQAPAYPLSDSAFAIESAFAHHIVSLKASAGQLASRLILVAPAISDAGYAAQQGHLAVIDSDKEGIIFLPSHQADASLADFWRGVPAMARRFRTQFADAALVHADLSTDARKPMTAIAALVASRMKKPVVFVVDVDFRRHAERSLQLGHWGRGKYLFNRLVQDSFKTLQVRRAVRKYQLALLKSASMVRDFGQGRPQVKNFYDTAHSAADLLPEGERAARLDALASATGPLRMCYFGRLVAYKGIDRMIAATALARARGADVHLTIIGDGPVREALQRQVAEAGLGDHVGFEEQVPYGEPLFARLRNEHIALATPLLEDTPRAAFDAMARGLPILAFDTSYFRDLAEASGAVALAQWPDAAALADQMVALAADRPALGRMAAGGLTFAADNTQAIWVDRRIGWTAQFAHFESDRVGR